MTTDKAHHQKSVSEWQTGYFLGIVEASTAYIVCNATGAYACTTIKRLPDDESYDKACLDEVKVTVFEYFEHGIKTKATGPARPYVRGGANPDSEPVVPAGGGFAPRNFRITADLLEKYGVTPGCPGCAFTQLKVGPRGHTAECRSRIEELMAQDDRDKVRLENASRRKEHFTARDDADAAVAANESEAIEPEDVDLDPDMNVPLEWLLENGRQDATETRLPPASPAKDKHEDLQDGRVEDPDIRIPSPLRAKAQKRGGRDIHEDEPNSKVVINASRSARSANEDNYSDGERALSAPAMDDEEEFWNFGTVGGDTPPRTSDGDIVVDSMSCMSSIEAKILAHAMLGVDITEVYSPERVTKLCAKFGLVQGSALDLTNGWDFDLEDHRKQAWKLVTSEQPFLIIGSPPCTLFSLLQELAKAQHGHNAVRVQNFNEKMRKATAHVEFCITLYRYQLKVGKHFVHEHPWSARSWLLESMKSLEKGPEDCESPDAHVPVWHGFIHRQERWAEGSSEEADGIPHEQHRHRRGVAKNMPWRPHSRATYVGQSGCSSTIPSETL